MRRFRVGLIRSREVEVEQQGIIVVDDRGPVGSKFINTSPLHPSAVQRHAEPCEQPQNQGASKQLRP